MITKKEHAEIIEACKREQPNYAAQLTSVPPTNTNRDGEYKSYDGEFMTAKEQDEQRERTKQQEIHLTLGNIVQKLDTIISLLNYLTKR